MIVIKAIIVLLTFGKKIKIKQAGTWRWDQQDILTLFWTLGANDSSN